MCANGRTGARGRSDYLSYLPGDVGRHLATWTVDGVEVERWRFKVVPENA
ncbi:MAG: hypothetical protein ACRDLO_01485 [Solirubrobacterales bacterium]